jgi:magnesium-transporting ATPase (P-type)
MDETEKIEEVKIKDKADDFKLERYKFILQQLNSLNEGTHKYIALFQTLLTAILGAGIAIFAAGRESKIDSYTAQLGIRAILWLFTILTLFVILSIIMNAISWFDYRKEEVEILSKEVNENFRQLPSWKNFWRWSETYFVAFLIITLLAVWIFTKLQLIPTIQ